jgi:hypothetical protein
VPKKIKQTNKQTFKKKEGKTNKQTKRKSNTEKRE